MKKIILTLLASMSVTNAASASEIKLERLLDSSISKVVKVEKNFKSKNSGDILGELVIKARLDTCATTKVQQFVHTQESLVSGNKLKIVVRILDGKNESGIRSGCALEKDQKLISFSLPIYLPRNENVQTVLVTQLVGGREKVEQVIHSAEVRDLL